MADMFSVAKSVPLTDDMSEMARSFGEVAVEKLNSLLPAVGPVGTDPRFSLTSVGFAGFTKAGPVVALRRISFNIDRWIFEAGLNEPHVNRETFVVLNHDYFDATQKIIASPEFQAIRTRNYQTKADQLARMMGHLLIRIIRLEQSPLVGGVPNVMVLEKGKKPRWHLRAKDCPDLQ
jgi:hypothetical protein